MSDIVSPNIFDPSVCSIEEVTIDDVILVTFNLVASIAPTVISGVPVKPVAKPAEDESNSVTTAELEPK